jgi:hypothetical protein
MSTLPPGVIPIRDLTTREILYGARSTTIRYELLEHNAATGVDSLIGYLDGVRDDGTVRGSAAASVKKSGTLSVLDLPTAAAGLTRIADVDIITTRIRPVLVVDGLPEMPWSVYVVTASPERWSGTGRTFSIELHDKSTVLEQDAVEVTFTAPTGTAVLSIVKTVIESAGERIDIDASDTRTLTSPLVWDAGTSKLKIVNDLLNAIAYNALWVDSVGSFRATATTRPAQRSIRYSALNDDDGQRLMRELADGAESIYGTEWARDRDTYKVPSKVVAIAAGTGAAGPLSGVATNLAAPVVRVKVLPGVEVPEGTDASKIAFLEAKARQSLIASSSVQAAVSLKCLPIPLELLDAIRFASAPAGIDARHTVQSYELQLRFDGLMSLELQEVVDL